MKSWVFTSHVEPPTGVVTGRFGQSIMFVAYSRLLRQWYWIVPGGEEKIAEPEMLYVEQGVSSKLNHSNSSSYLMKSSKHIRQRKSEQLALDF